MTIIGENLRRLRKAQKFTQNELASRSGVSQQLISQIETGENETTTELPSLANALRVAVSEIDPAYAADADGLPTITIPLLSWVSAGSMMREDIQDEAIGAIRVADLPPKGDWLALKVEGSSMDRISPPESVIYVDRKDKKLVANACYVIADDEGNATYKRYRPDPMRFEPVSTGSYETIFPENEPLIVGRVKRTTLSLE